MISYAIQTFSSTFAEEQKHNSELCQTVGTYCKYDITNSDIKIDKDINPVWIVYPWEK